MERIALITGAGTGIGQGIALALAQRGVSVALTGRRRGPLESVSAAIAPFGVRTAILPADLGVPGEREQLVAGVHAALGPLDILVNNAGVLMGGDLATLTAADIEQAVAVNLTAAIDLTRRSLGDLTARRGSIVFIGSNMQRVPLPSAALYSATKSALGNLAAALRYELEPLGIHLLVVYPPDTDTAMVQRMTRRAGWSEPWLASPVDVGERIVAALGNRERNLQWGGGSRALAILYRLAPRLVQAVFRKQRTRLSRMMASEEDRCHR